jgi:hypothetical protein
MPGGKIPELEATPRSSRRIQANKRVSRGRRAERLGSPKVAEMSTVTRKRDGQPKPGRPPEQAQTSPTTLRPGQTAGFSHLKDHTMAKDKTLEVNIHAQMADAA